MTDEHPGPGPAQAVRLDIARVTLDGYSPRRREYFARALTAQITGQGAPAAQARQAAAAILDAVDARLGGPRA